MFSIDIGTRVVVQGIMHAEARVKDVTWLEKESRWEIILDWGEHGTSKVYSSDENKVWYQYQSSN